VKGGKPKSRKGGGVVTVLKEKSQISNNEAWWGTETTDHTQQQKVRRIKQVFAAFCGPGNEIARSEKQDVL
jgi:hypothetical protein